MDPDKNPNAHYETPYVVHLQNRTELAPPQPLFTFVHPLKGKIDNNRYVVTFPRTETGNKMLGVAFIELVEQSCLDVDVGTLYGLLCIFLERADRRVDRG